MNKRSFLCLLIICVLILAPCLNAFALQSTTLTLGSTGNTVVLLQQALIDLGYLTGKADGKFGPMTRNAVISFQKKNGLTADGLAGLSTQKKLFALSSVSSVPTAEPVTTPATVILPTATPVPNVSSTSLFGDNYATLRPGTSGARVLALQKALNSLGFSCGTPDGKYGNKTENAIRSFQRKNGLTSDGLAGKKTLLKIESLTGGSVATPIPTSTPAPSPTPVPTVAPTSLPATQPVSGNYVNLSKGSSGPSVTALQQALKDLKYDVSVTGKYDEQTRLAVIAFQQLNKLTADGVAGTKTQTSLYSGNAVTGDRSLPGLDSGAGKIDPPAASELKLLHWFNDIKPTVKAGQTILVYDPQTGLAWNLRFLSLGRHADSEPLTLLDTQIMETAFGKQNTWNQKAVWVRLPSGIWTIASTHDMPHLSGSIKDNGFDGHLCVHFLRDMSECEKNDPNYGVANQKTIRDAWKKLTGEEIAY